MQTAKSTIKKSIRKSVALLPLERVSLENFVNGFTSKTEAAEKLRVSRQVLDRVMLVGSGSHVNISIIRKKLKAA